MEYLVLLCILLPYLGLLLSNHLKSKSKNISKDFFTTVSENYEIYFYRFHKTMIIKFYSTKTNTMRIVYTDKNFLKNQDIKDTTHKDVYINESDAIRYINYLISLDVIKVKDNGNKGTI